MASELILSDNSTNLNLTNDSIMSNENILQNTLEQFGETVSTPTCITSIKTMTKRRRIDPVWDFIDEIDNKRYCKLCRKEYSKETGITTIKGHFKRDHPNSEF